MSVLLHATVLRLLNHKEESTPDMLSVEGTVVRVKASSKFYDASPKDAGIVLGSDKLPGWVIVSFGPVNGRTAEIKQRFRTGNPSIDDGACDLELDKAEEVFSAVVSLGSQLMEVPLSGHKASPGDILRLEPKTFRVVGAESAIPSGEVVFVSQVIGKDYVSVQAQSGKRTVSAGKFSGKLEVNGQVVLDSSLSVIIENYGLEDGSFSAGQTEKLVTWDDIFGQEGPKRELQEAVEGIMDHPMHYTRYSKKPPKGILLSGPPGCSKTMFGKAVYASIVKRCQALGINPSQGFILVRGPEFLDKFVGVGEASIRHVFARARKFREKYGVPAVIFIDECEAVMAKREGGISSDVLKTIVPTILTEMDGVVECGALVIGATNKPEILDFAMTRPGRFDKSIVIGRPDQLAVKQIFVHNMRKVPISGTQEELSNILVAELFSPELVIYKIRRRDSDKDTLFTLADIVSGAMIPAIAEEAKELALTRDLVNKVPVDSVTVADVKSAVTKIYKQNLVYDHAEALRDFTMNFADQILSAEKQIQVRG
jgi:ATP-dependent 26S proteasome regulatory subunit